MKNEIMVVVIGLGLIVAGCATNPNSKTAWEYKLLKAWEIRQYGVPSGEPGKRTEQKQRIENCFRELGNDGWEYVGVCDVSEDGKQLSVFKRPATK